MTVKFRPGDQVVKKNGRPFSNGELVATIDRYCPARPRHVYLRETGKKIGTIALDFHEQPQPAPPEAMGEPPKASPILSVTISRETVLAALSNLVKEDLGIDADVHDFISLGGMPVELKLGASNMHI